MAEFAAKKRVRMDAGERRQALIDTAREVFATSGYQRSGLAEIAERSEVSKTLLYHYFEGGRPELYAHIIDQLGDQLLAEVRSGFRRRDRPVEAMIDGFFRFFASNPDALKLLLEEPEVSGEPQVLAASRALRMKLGIEIGTALSAGGQPAERTLAGAMAIIGVLSELTAGWLSGEVDRSVAESVAHDFIVGGLERAGFR